MTAWRPLLPNRLSTIIATAIAAVPLILMVLTMVAALRGTDEGPAVLLAVWGFLAALSWAFWRVCRQGVYLSDHALRVQHFADSDVVEWSDVLRFVVRPATYGGPIPYDVEEIWVIRRDGEAINTTIMRRITSPFGGLLRPGLVRAHITEADFERAMQVFEEALARSRERSPGSSA